MHKLLVVSGLCGLSLCGSAGLAAAQAPSIDDLINLKRVGAPAISPDGRRVAFTIRETNWDENAYETELWLANVASGPPRQLANAKRSSSTDYPDVYVAPVRTVTAKKISDTASQIAAWPKHGRETMRWKSQDGAEIEGVLHKPADFQAGRRAKSPAPPPASG